MQIAELLHVSVKDNPQLMVEQDCSLVTASD